MNKVKDDIKFDASSKFQENLPTSSDDLLMRLDQWNIKYKCYNHPPLRTVDESKKYQENVLNLDPFGAHIKNLYFNLLIKYIGRFINRLLNIKLKVLLKQSIL